MAGTKEDGYVIVWGDTDGDVHTLVFHELNGSTPIRFYARDQLRSSDAIVTDAEQAETLIHRTSVTEQMAIPVSLARELGWFPDCEYANAE